MPSEIAETLKARGGQHRVTPYLSPLSGRPARLPGHHGSAMIEVYPDLESLSRAAAALLVEQANLAVAARGRFSVALAGGATPRRTYELLAAPPLKDQAPWDRVHVFWGDERCVPLNDSRSNARLAKEAWLDRVPIPADPDSPAELRLRPGRCGPAV